MTITLLVLTFLALFAATNSHRRVEILSYVALSAAFAAGAVLTWLVVMGRV